MDLLVVLFILVVLAVVFGGIFLNPLVFLGLLLLAAVAYYGRGHAHGHYH